MNTATRARAALDTPARGGQPLRIACVTETYPPEVNGVATTLACFVNGLLQRGHAVQLVRPRQGKADGSAAVRPGLQQVLVPGLPIPQYPHLRMGLPAGRLLARLWAQQRPDVVHIATEGPLGWSALGAAQRLGLPVASDFRTNFHAYSRHYRLGWLQRPILGYLRRFHNRGDYTMVPTRPLAGELQAQGFERLRVVGRGVDTQHFSPAQRSAALRAQWNADAHAPVLLCVGRLAAEKNLQALLRAYAAVRAAQPAARLVLVGSGPLEGWLRQQCPEAVFAGSRRGEDLARHYASADLFVFPSQSETFGNVTVEALASGLPVVAFNLAAAAQLVQPQVHGLLAEPDDEAGFCQAALRLAGDAALRARMAQAARECALDIDWQRIVRDLECVLREAMLRQPGHHARAAELRRAAVRPS